MQESDLDNTRSSKEMWLFLIFLDIAALCVIAYFIYNSFGGEIQKKVSALTASNKPTQTFVEEVLVEEPKLPTTKAEEKKPVLEPKKAETKEPAKETPKTEVKTEPAKAENETPKAEVKAETAPKTTTAPATTKTATTEKKQSVFISGTGKTRKVTFKYYDDAKKVAIISGFTSRKPVNLVKKNGVWETTLILYPGDYKYMYIVDNIETLDPNAPSENGRSVLKVR